MAEVIIESGCTKEPAMRLARPSSPRHQDVSCVLAGVFGSLYSQDVLHDDTIVNLETSRTHDPDFHDYYVQLLNQIRTERTERLSALSKVEEHMLSAYKLAQEQSALLKEDASQTSLGIPEKHVSIGSFLDTDLLNSYNLLTPASYLRPPPPSLQPPTEPILPHFMGNTMVMEEHEKARNVTCLRQPIPPQVSSNSLKRSTLSAGKMRIKAPARAAWRDSMNPDVRLDEQKGLEKLQARSNFLKTKRFGPDQTQEATPEAMFCAVPSTIIFNSYEIGKIYEQKLKIKNVSTTSRQLKVLPPSSKHFTINKSADPSANGAIAPGLSAEFTVTFMPDSLADFEDCLQVVPQGGTLFGVLLSGQRPPPVLSLPEILDCGHTLVNSTMHTTFSCLNTGGDALFHIYPAGEVKEPFLFNDLTPPQFEYCDGPFTVTPTAFLLKTGQEAVINVKFIPSEVEKYSTSFSLVSDNCTERIFTVQGESETCHVEVIAVSGHQAVDYDIRDSETPEPITVKFPDQNPGTCEEKLLILRNCVNVPLHYCWEMCKEIIQSPRESPAAAIEEVITTAPAEAPSEAEPAEAEPAEATPTGDEPPETTPAPGTVQENVTSPVLEDGGEEMRVRLIKPVSESPFSISPAVGVLAPNQELSFSLTCSPHRTGKYDNVARLWVDDVPTLCASGEVKLERHDAVRVSLTHLSQPHKVCLEPPALVIPGECLMGVPISKMVKVINDSLSDVSVSWNVENAKGMKCCTSPSTFTVGANSTRTVEVEIVGTAVGKGDSVLSCNLSQQSGSGSTPLQLFVQAEFSGPNVIIDTPALDFGYIHYKTDCASQREVVLRNTSGAPADWTLQELDHCIDPAYGQSEFELSKSSGTLGPFGVQCVYITFRPFRARAVRTFLECIVDNGTGSKVNVKAEVQAPHVVLKQSELDLGVVYVGVPVKHVVALQSLNFADCAYRCAQVEGMDKEFGELAWREPEGRIWAGGELKLVFEFTGTVPTVIEDYTVAIQIDGMPEGLALGIKCTVMGLCVQHETPDEDDLNQGMPPCLDFASVPILTPVTRVLKIINNTAIGTHFKVEIMNFKGTSSRAPPTAGAPLGTESSMRPSSQLLSRTPLLLDPSSKTKAQSDTDYWKDQLKGNKGVSFTATPSNGYLPGNGVTIITVHANSDMWGSYSDVIVSQVGELEPVLIPIKMEVTGSPLYYKLSNNTKPTVRFGSYPINHAPISRSVLISNQGPQDIRLDWQTFNTLNGDDILIDLNFFVGDAFPLNDQPSSTTGDLIRLGISAHEGVASKGPFIFSPTQCVIPARDSAKVQLSFNPSNGLGECGGVFSSYALAYQSLDYQKNTGNCLRKQGEQVEPLKLMMTGKIEKPELVVTAEEHGFTFKLMAGVLLRGSGMSPHTMVHRMSLLNSSKLHLEFSLSAPAPFTLDNCPDSYNLTPRQKVKVNYGIQLTEGLLNTLLSSNRTHFKLHGLGNGQYSVSEDAGDVEVFIVEEMLQRMHDVKQSDGTVQDSLRVAVDVPEKRFHLTSHVLINYTKQHVQEVKINARIVLPTFYLTPQQVNFGTCLVGQTGQSTVRLVNPSSSPLSWNATYYGNTTEGEFALSPSTGKFTGSDSVIINLSFTARSYNTCNGVIRFTCTPGNHTVDLPVEGVGSHDERMQKLL